MLLLYILMLCFLTAMSLLLLLLLLLRYLSNFERIDSVAAGINVAAVHQSFFHFDSAVAEIVVVVDHAGLRRLSHFLLLIKNQTLSIEIP